jgi:hypothetical protein
MSNERKENLIKDCKILLPPAFLVNCGDERVSAFIDMVIGDLNWWPPYTGYNLDNLPPQYDVIVKYGVSVFATLFLQSTYALQDFGWSDAGLSLQLDRVSKLDQSYKNVLEMYKQMVQNSKKWEIVRMGGLGLNTPRYQSQIGQFLKIALGSSMSWGSPQ